MSLFGVSLCKLSIQMFRAYNAKNILTLDLMLLGKLLCLPRHDSLVNRSDEDVDISGMDMIRVTVLEKVEMKFMDRNAPYKRTRVRARHAEIHTIFSWAGD